MKLKLGLLLLLLLAAEGTSPALADRAFGSSNQLPSSGNVRFYGHP